MVAPKVGKERKIKETKFVLSVSQTLSSLVANQLLPRSILLYYQPKITIPFTFALYHPGPLVYIFLVAGILLVLE
jgi:hypothetical protein